MNIFTDENRVYRNAEFKLQICDGNTLPDDTKIYDKVINFSLQLKPHQLQILERMIELEHNDIDINDTEYIQTEVGILANKVGSGKSLCILALIEQEKRLENRQMIKAKIGKSITIMNKNKSREIKGGNLIVSPHHIMKSVWENYIKSYTNLNYQLINKKSFPINWDDMCTYDVVLCNASNYNEFIKNCPWTWSRVIFDEVDTINIPSCIYPKYRFVWFITSSLMNLLFPNGYSSLRWFRRRDFSGLSHIGYIKDMFRSIEYMSNPDILSKIILKQSNEYIDSILNIPKQLDIKHKCKAPNYVNVLSNYVGRDMLNKMNAGNYEGCLESLGCNVDTKENIITLVCKSLNDKLNNLSHKLEYLQSINVLRFDQESHLNKIEKTKKNMIEIQNRITNIHDKIHNLEINETETCPICFDLLNKNSVMLNCCKHIFCLRCIGNLLTTTPTSRYSCPMCRAELNSKDLLHIGVKKDYDIMPTKEACLLNLIQNNPENKFLIFSSYDQSFTKICLLLDKHSISYSKLIGNQNVINSTLDKYNNDKNNILMLNASHFGCGLNLTNTTDLVFFHKMNIDIKTQVLGRAQRFGRTSRLNVHYLYHENEYDENT